MKNFELLHPWPRQSASPIRSWSMQSGSECRYPVPPADSRVGQPRASQHGCALESRLPTLRALALHCTRLVSRAPSAGRMAHGEGWDSDRQPSSPLQRAEPPGAGVCLASRVERAPCRGGAPTAAGSGSASSCCAATARRAPTASAPCRPAGVSLAPAPLQPRHRATSSTSGRAQHGLPSVFLPTAPRHSGVRRAISASSPDPHPQRR